MFDALYIYFKEEKIESLWFILIGIISILFSIWLFFKFKDGFYRGLIIPVVLISLIQITVGTSVYLRTDKQIEIIVDRLKVEKQIAQAEELLRMEVVMKILKFTNGLSFYLLFRVSCFLFSSQINHFGVE